MKSLTQPNSPLFKYCIEIPCQFFTHPFKIITESFLCHRFKSNQ